MISAKKALEMAAEEWNFLGSNTGIYEVAHFGWVFNTGKCKVYDSMACHAGLKYFDGTDEESTNIIAIISEVLNFKKLKTERIEAYYSWLFNDSPVAKAFISKDASKVLEEGVIFLSVKVTFSNLGFACMATRYPWENKDIVYNWYELVRMGVCPRKAFLVAHCIEGTTENCRLVVRRDSYGHVVFGDSLTTSTYTNFVNGKQIDHFKEASYLKEINNIVNKRTIKIYNVSIEKLFKMNGTYLAIELSQLVDANYLINKIKKDSTNPFKQNVRREYYHKDELLKTIAKIIPELDKKLLKE